MMLTKSFVERVYFINKGETMSEILVNWDLLRNSSDPVAIIPDGVTTIPVRGMLASSATTVQLPFKTLERIEREAFRHSNIEKIFIPQRVTVGKSAFECASLKNVHSHQTIIEEYTFSNCSSLTEVILNETEIIRQRAFSNTAIKKIDIPDTVEEIGKFVFYNCIHLQSVKMPKKLDKISESMFCGCVSLTDLTLPEQIEKIEDSAFGACENLKTVTIPEGCKEIEYGAFKSCKKLETLKLPMSLERVGKNIIEKCDSLRELQIPYKAFGQFIKSNDLPLSLQKIIFDDFTLESDDLGNFKIQAGQLKGTRLEDFEKALISIPTKADWTKFLKILAEYISYII